MSDPEGPVKVFVATQEPQMLSFKVLEYSIRKHSSMPVAVVPLHRAGISCPVPKDEGNRQRTPFSFQRFMIPEVVDYSGRAIYLDSDMQVFSDIDALWSVDMQGYEVAYCQAKKSEGRGEQFSVMLLDCNKLEWSVRRIVEEMDRQLYGYGDLMGSMCISSSKMPLLPATWNSLEFYQRGETNLVHYTDMQTQPWVDHRNPLSALWFQDLFEAIDDGELSDEFVDEHISCGWVRPSIRYQIDNRIVDSRELPAKALKLDQEFKAPYEAIMAGRRWKSLLSLAEAQKRILRVYRRLTS